MAKRVNNNQNSNINIVKIKMVERPVKTFKYCWKCGKQLPEGSLEPFCNDYDNYCRNQYYTENAREIDSVWREIRGID